MTELTKCPTQKELRDLHHGDLNAESCAELETHIDACPLCRASLAAIAATDSDDQKTHIGFRAPDADGPESSDGKTQLRFGAISSVGAPRSDDPLLALLQPAQEADEIGRIGNYRLLKRLGSGGMGIVFHAEDLVLRRAVALKLIRPDIRDQEEGWQRLLREARAMAAIKHEHLITVYQAGREGDVFYLAMELLKGESLDERILREPQPSVAEIMSFSKQVAAGLGAIHQHGLVHRDIKPSNIWLEAPNARARILDFGLARHSEAGFNSTLTESGTIVGTPAFMSPEQARGGTVTPRSDLFSFGCVMFCACTGRMPFAGPTLMAQLTALAVDTPPPVRFFNKSVPQALNDVVAKLLQKEPEKRFASAEELLSELERIEKAPVAASVPALQNKPVLAPPNPAPPVAPAKPEEKAPALEKKAEPVVVRQQAVEPAPIAPEKKSSAGMLLVIIAGCILLAAAAMFLGKKEQPQTPRTVPPPPPATQVLPPPVEPKTAETKRPPPDDSPPPPDDRPPDDRPPDDRRPRNRYRDAELAEKLKAFAKGDGSPRTYALDLASADDAFNVKFPEASGKKTARRFRGPPDAFQTFSVQNEPSPHGIGQHPDRETPSSVVLKLGRQYANFAAYVSQNDGLPIAEGMIFSVIGDGKLLWRSKPVTSQEATQEVNVSVKDVDVLKLELDCEGPPMAAHGIWFEPYLTK